MLDSARFGSGWTTPLEAMATIRPQPRSRMPGSTALTSVCCTRSRSCRAFAVDSVSRVDAVAGGGPGPFSTRMSISPNASCAARNSSSGPPGAVRSTATPTALGSSAATDLARSSRRPDTTTFAPSAPSARALAAPSPLVEAHTTAVRPVIPRSTALPQGRPPGTSPTLVSEQPAHPTSSARVRGGPGPSSSVRVASGDRGERGKGDDAVHVAALALVESPAAGDQAQLGVRGVAVDIHGGEGVFADLLQLGHREDGGLAVLAGQLDLVTVLYLVEPGEDAVLPVPVDVSEDDRRPGRPRGRPQPVPAGLQRSAHRRHGDCPIRVEPQRDQARARID